MAFNTGITGGDANGLWQAGTDGTHQNLNAGLFGWGAYADFPAAASSNKGMMAYATDKGLYYSDGSAWQPVQVGNGYVHLSPWLYDSNPAGTWSAAAFPVASNAYANSIISDGNNGTKLTYKVWLMPGTYTLKMMCETYSSRGIATWDINGSDVATFDTYSAGDVINVIKTQTGIAVTATGVISLSVRANGKNASSSNYFLAIQDVVLYRTA